MLRKYHPLLEKMSFLPPSDVCRLIHSEAMVNLTSELCYLMSAASELFSHALSLSQMLNQSLLASRRSVAHLLLFLHEESLQQASLLHLHWEDCLSHWKTSRVSNVLDRLRWVMDQNSHSGYRQVPVFVMFVLQV